MSLIWELDGIPPPKKSKETMPQGKPLLGLSGLSLSGLSALSNRYTNCHALPQLIFMYLEDTFFFFFFNSEFWFILFLGTSPKIFLQPNNSSLYPVVIINRHLFNVPCFFLYTEFYSSWLVNIVKILPSLLCKPVY